MCILLCMTREPAQPAQLSSQSRLPVIDLLLWVAEALRPPAAYLCSSRGCGAVAEHNLVQAEGHAAAARVLEADLRAMLA
jgi:hypothetical protein